MAQNGAKDEPRIGRLRAAWYVLMGQRLTPQHIQAEWVEYQQIFNDLLERWSAKLARDARAEKDRIKRLDVATPVAPAATVSEKKQELRRRVANMRGFGLVSDALIPKGFGLTSDAPIHEVKNEPDS